MCISVEEALAEVTEHTDSRKVHSRKIKSKQYGEKQVGCALTQMKKEQKKVKYFKFYQLIQHSSMHFKWPW